MPEEVVTQIFVVPTGQLVEMDEQSARTNKEQLAAFGTYSWIITINKHLFKN